MKAVVITAVSIMLASGLYAQKSTPQVASNTTTAHTDIARKTVTNDPDGMVVTEVPSAENELPIGAAIWMTLKTPLYSNISHPGERFTGTVSRDVLAHGKVLIPAGATIMGKVVYAHDGNRWLLGKAKLRIRPEDLILPDGTHIPMYANIVDTARTTGANTSGDGTITSGPSGATDYLLLRQSRASLPAGTELVMELTKPLEFGGVAQAATK